MSDRTFVAIITAGVWILVILLAWIILTWSTKVHAADDLVCKPYASQLINNNMSFFWMRAFNHCKLLEEDNPIPPPTGDWRDALDIIEPEPNHTPIAPPPASAEPLPLDKIGNVPAAEKPVTAITPAKPAQAATPVKRSSASVAAAPTSASAIAIKCKSTHPSGFQAGGSGGRGTYNTLVGKKWVRVPCS